jgi:hypothetical protein
MLPTGPLATVNHGNDPPKIRFKRAQVDNLVTDPRNRIVVSSFVEARHLRKLVWESSQRGDKYQTRP